MFHYRKTHQRYKGFPKSATCQFCELAESALILEETKHHYLVANRVFYDIWELRRVTDHLMIVPKRHVHSLADLNDKEMLDHGRLAARYELQGYNVYARAATSKVRSVAHQHTHLIKTDTKPKRGMFMLSKPYLFFTIR